MVLVYHLEPVGAGVEAAAGRDVPAVRVDRHEEAAQPVPIGEHVGAQHRRGGSRRGSRRGDAAWPTSSDRVGEPRRAIAAERMAADAAVIAAMPLPQVCGQGGEGDAGGGGPAGDAARVRAAVRPAAARRRQSVWGCGVW